MESTLNALQHALFEQLTSQPLDTQSDDVESALKQLKAVTSSKKVLIVCRRIGLLQEAPGRRLFKGGALRHLPNVSENTHFPILMQGMAHEESCCLFQSPDHVETSFRSWGFH